MTLGFVLRTAWREGRASARRFLVLVLAVAIGVAALVAINSFTENLRETVEGRARSLLGADLRLGSRRPVSARALELADSLAGGGTSTAQVTFFGAMGYVPRTEGARTVNVTAIEGRYPFYGEIATRPDGAWARLHEGRHALVDPSLLTALAARIGDSLSLGERRFAIVGALESFPGDVGIGSAFAPRVVISARELEATGLLRFGSRAQYVAYLRLPDPAAADAVADRLRPLLREQRVSVRSAEQDQRNLTEALGRLASYLGLVALIALLLGGLGVASAVHVFIRRKLETIAILRCLGATARQVFVIYLVQAAVVGLGGSLLGALGGLALQAAVPRLLADFLPVDVVIRPSWRAVALGVGTGLWVAILFALLPLLAVRRVPPLAALRRAYEPAPPVRDRLRWPLRLLVAASVLALAMLQADDWRAGLAFAAGIALALAGLALAAWLLIRGVRRWFPSRWPYVWRQGLANLYRPANQTTAVVLALGFGTFLLATLLLVQHNLLRELATTGGARRPNLVLIDVQPAQRDSVEALLRAADAPVLSPVPIVPMRIESVNGRPVGAIGADTAGVPPDERPARWALRREYRSTWRDTLVSSERLVEGAWWNGAAAPDGEPVPISVETGVARELGVALGDRIVWDVQGLPITTRVASLREVDWARFEPNFFVVFPPGALERAPQTLVHLTRVPDAAARGRLQRTLAERLPNVTTLDLSLLQAALEQVLDRVVLAIRFMALFSLATGALVLVGAVATSRYQRVREGVLLRTLGATRRQVVRVLFAEYLALGLMAAGTALGLAAGSGWALAHFLFDTGFALPLPALAALALTVLLLTLVVGLTGSLDAVRRPPLEVLREEAA